MAHICPDCGFSCHCNGDIDDICFGERYDCRCDCSDWNEDDDYDFYEEEE